MTQLAFIHHSLRWRRDGRLEESDILNTPSQPLLKVVESRKTAKAPGLCFMCFPAEEKKEREGLRTFLQNLFMCVDVGISKLLTALPGHTSSYPLQRLMAFHQNVQPGVDGANEIVSQPCDPRGA